MFSNILGIICCCLIIVLMFLDTSTLLELIKEHKKAHKHLILLYSLSIISLIILLILKILKIIFNQSLIIVIICEITFWIFFAFELTTRILSAKKQESKNEIEQNDK